MISDQLYLKDSQYKTPSNLEARIALHKLYGTNPYGWHKWVFDQLHLSPGMRVLEIGCGSALLWEENLQRLPENVGIIASDLSAGMVQQTAKLLAGQSAVTCLVLDAQSIPLRNDYFDIVVANHMLYHVPQIEIAVREFKRVLKKNGILCAATNGVSHMQELIALIQQFSPDYTDNAKNNRFSLEAAPEILRSIYDEIKIFIYEDNLAITDVAPVVAYIRSLWSIRDFLSLNGFANLEDQIAKHIRTEGSLNISKSQGVILARK
jgi:ubiquinone/menaquinone biosynthesis C-methylase UbiE